MTNSTKTRCIPFLLSLLLADMMALPSVCLASQTSIKLESPKFTISTVSTNIPWLIPLGVFAIMLILIIYPVIVRRLSWSKYPFTKHEILQEKQVDIIRSAAEEHLPQKIAVLED